MLSREDSRREFLKVHELADAALQPLAQDASARRYFRLPDQNLLLMDAPPPGEKPGDFVRITDYLQRLGARVPSIHAADPENGFVLLEDLGEQTFTRLLDAGESAEALYQLATDELIGFQQRCTKGDFTMELAPYDLSAALDEVSLFVDWYLPARSGRPMDGGQRQAFLTLWSGAFNQLPACEPVLVHRDFHVDNLLLAGSRCGLIDYQDALLGSPVYDLVSLLEDARRDVDPKMRQRLVRHWQAGMAMENTVFQPHYDFWGAQRHCKVAGIFVRLWQRDNKPHYLRHLARVMSLLSNRLAAADDLEPIRRWIAGQLGDISHGDLSTF